MNVIVFLVICITILFVDLVIVSAMRPADAQFSQFELQRRARHSNQSAIHMLSKQQHYTDIMSVIYLYRMVSVVLITILSILAFGWGWGILLTVLLVIFSLPLSRLSMVSRIADTIYQKIEERLIGFLLKIVKILPFIRGPFALAKDIPVGSRQEIEHLLNESTDILSDAEKNLVIHGLRFQDKTDKQIMTPKSEISYVKKTEMLGPLVLSELHDMGHSRLPVIDKDIHHIVGILHLTDLLTLDNKKTMLASQAMEPRVVYLHQDDSLEQALGVFVKSHYHICIVVDDNQHTVGVATLTDVIEALVGRKIHKETGQGTLA